MEKEPVTEVEVTVGYTDASQNPPPQGDANNAPQYPPQGGVYQVYVNAPPQNTPLTYNNAHQQHSPHGGGVPMQSYAQHPQHVGIPVYANAPQNAPPGAATAPQYPQPGSANAYANAPQYPQPGGAHAYANTPQYPQPGGPMSYVPQINPQQVLALDYSTGLFDFTDDINLFCVAFWCPCITFGQIAEIVDRGASSCGVSAAIYVLVWNFTLCQFLYSYMYGAKMKAQYGIHSDAVADICIHLWCQPCVLTQEYRELQLRGYNPALGWFGNMNVVPHNPRMTAPSVPNGMTR